MNEFKTLCIFHCTDTTFIPLEMRVVVHYLLFFLFIPSSLKATNYKPVTTQGAQKIERPIYIQDKYLGTFILGANIEVGENRDGNGSCYIKAGAGQGLLLKLPQSGVSFSTTSDKIHVDSASGTVTGLHAGTFDITMTVKGVSFTNQYTCWGKSFNDVTFSLEKSSFDYTGKEIKPKASLYDNKSCANLRPTKSFGVREPVKA